jgi:hypothetical protein
VGKNMIKTICDNCGIEMEKTKWEFNRCDNHFCSKECRYNYQKEYLRGENNPNWRGGLIKVNCANCQIELQRKICDVERTNIHVCSPECRGKWISNNLKGENHPIYSKVDYDCDECNKTIKLFKTYATNGMKHFCSDNCKQLNHSKNMSGENNPNWTGNTPFIKAIRLCKEYYEWRNKCFERDEYICQSCNKGNNKLIVHHKTPLIKIIKVNEINTMEDAKLCYELWDINNGITLCHKCHLLEHPNGYNKWSDE